MNDEIKKICSKCEGNIHCQGKGCAFRSLGNEYCDEVENANKLINNLQQERDKYKAIINGAIELLNNECESCNASLTNPEYTIVSKHDLLRLELKSLRKIIKELEEGNSNDR
jgi:hypothetical protein